jgi:hypothetical protein
MGSFAADIRAFGIKRTADLRAVVQESVQDTVDDMQANVPIDTGFLKNSLASGLNGSFGPPGENDYLLTIAGMDLGDVARFAYTADYAIHQELGSQGRAGRHFMGTAAAKWPETVRRNAARIK